MDKKPTPNNTSAYLELRSSLQGKSFPLKVHEWLAIALIIAAIGSLAVITSYSKKGATQADQTKMPIQNRSGIEILIKGAVEYPGIYRLPSEMLMKDLLELARLQPDADLRRYNLDRPVKRGRAINVPARHMIKVYLKGAVKNPGPIAIPKGTRMMDLLEVIAFEKNADKKALQKKRKLKPEEIVEVPFCNL
jgi:protein involved in polysaccharide export with SLBB domain